MSKEKIDQKDPTLREYENIIEELMKENETLKKQIIKLEDENKRLKVPMEIIEASPIVHKEIKKPVKFIPPKKVHESSKEIKLDANNELFTPITTFRSSQKPIIEGVSRRECPACENTRHIYIHEEIDKTNIILEYPRVFGKKYRCGICGTEWRVNPTIE